MDFFFWGAVKTKVDEINPHTVNELKDYISDAITEIYGDRNLCCTVCQSVTTDFKIAAWLKADILSTREINY